MKTKFYLFLCAILSSMVLQAQDYNVGFVDPPTTVVAGDMVTFTVSYKKTSDITTAYAYVRFKTPQPNSENIASSNESYAKITTIDEGTISVTCEAPLDAGVGYILQGQLFDARTNEWKHLATKDIPGITVTPAPPPAKMITIVNPPTKVVAGTFVDITFDYRKDIPNAAAFIRFRDSGNLTDTSVTLDANEGTKTVSVEIPDSATPGTGYSFQAQMFNTDNWNIGAVVQENVLNIEVLADPNSVKMVAPPSKVTVGAIVAVDVEYTKEASIAAATVKLLFKDANGVINEVSEDVTANEGTVSLSVQAPAIVGSDYILEAQIINKADSNTLATETKTGVIAEEVSPYSVTFVDPPTLIPAATDIDFEISYTKDDAQPMALLVVRFKDANGNLEQTLTPVTDNAGTITVAVTSPTVLASGYSLQAQLLSGDGQTVLYTEDVVGTVTVESATPNTLTLDEAPSTLIAGKNVDVTFSYTNSVKYPKVHAFIRLKRGADEIVNANKVLTAGAGTHTVSFTVPIDAEIATDYYYQVQLFVTPGYANIVHKDLPANIAVEAYVPTGENTLEFVNTSADPINNGDKRTVNVKYNTLQESWLLVEIRDLEGGTGSTKIGEKIIKLQPGNETLAVELVVDGGHPSASNKIQALLFKTDWSGVHPLPETPTLMVAKGDGTITYRGQPYSSADENYNQNALFAESLGDGYYSNFYIADGWKGPLKFKFGQVGEPSWIEYENQNTAGQGHAEFDIKIQKFSWHKFQDSSVDRGYPRPLNEIGYPINTSLEGQWSAGSGGKGQINMTAWFTKTADMDDRVDVIVHVFDNGGNFRQKYDNNTVADNHEFNNLGEIISNGVTYQVLRTLPGYKGEVASYNLVPDAIVQADPAADYSIDLITANIDMKDVLGQLITTEANYTGTKVAIDNTWQINGLEWTVVGQSPQASTGKSGNGKSKAAAAGIPAGHGKFTFNSYVIPDITDVGLLGVEDNLKFKNLTLSPNPFSNSLTLSYDADLTAPVTLDLFAIDGRRIKSITIDNSFKSDSRTIDTEQLSKGIYIVRITSGNIQETRKLIKN